MSKIFSIFAPELKKIVVKFFKKYLHERFFSRIISARGRRAFINGDVLLMEMFLLPGFGIAGVSGFGCLLAAIVVAYIWIGRMAGYITLAACLILSALAIWGFLRSHALEKMALDSKIDSHVEMAHNKLNKEDKENQNKSQNSKEE